MSEIPVYLFTGFLESGKTKFISQTLEDKRFNHGDNILVLVCEEGIEEYDTSKYTSKNVFFRNIRSESELTEETLKRFETETHAKRVCVEYNGMWLIASLEQALPDNWTIYQEMNFNNAETFLTYNANMRNIVVDRFQNCDLVVFNRFDKKFDKMDFHKVVRATSRRTQIIYDYPDGHTEPDEIEDPLPFDVNADEIVIEDKDYALWYRDICENPKQYNGKRITVKGMVGVDKKTPEGMFLFGRRVMTCCVQDIRFMGLAVVYDKANELATGQFILLHGTMKIEHNKMYHGKGPVMYCFSYESAIQPNPEVAAFY